LATYQLARSIRANDYTACTPPVRYWAQLPKDLRPAVLDGLFGEAGPVPLIIRYPYSFAAGTRVSQPVSTVDLFPTIAAVLGIADERLALQMDGVDLQVVESSEHAERIVVCESLATPVQHLARLAPERDLKEFDHILRSAVWQHFKLIAGRNNGLELYALDIDPLEQNNLADSATDLACELLHRLAVCRRDGFPPNPICGTIAAI